MRRTLLIAVAALSVGGVVGQAVWNPVGFDNISAAMVWIVASNIAVGIAVGLQHHPFPTTLKKITAHKKAHSRGSRTTEAWTRKTWSPAAYSVAGQAAVGVILAVVLGIGATATEGFAGPLAAGLLVVLLASLVAAFSLVMGFLAASIVIWPLITLVRYLLQRVTGRTSSQVDTDGAVLNGIAFSLVAFAGFGGAAVPWDSGISRSIVSILPLLWDLFFDFDPNGEVNQPLAWVARGFGLVLIALIVTSIARSDRRRSLNTEKRRKARALAKSKRVAADAEMPGASSLD